MSCLLKSFLEIFPFGRAKYFLSEYFDKYDLCVRKTLCRVDIRKRTFVSALVVAAHFVADTRDRVCARRQFYMRCACAPDACVVRAHGEYVRSCMRNDRDEVRRSCIRTDHEYVGKSCIRTH